MPTEQKKHPLVKVRVVRPYPRDGVTHAVGALISIPEYALKDAITANPPFVERTETPVNTPSTTPPGGPQKA